MSTIVVTPPVEEPVTVGEAKLFLRIDTNDEDELVDYLITTARLMVEEYTKRALITRTLTSVVAIPPLTHTPLTGVIGKKETRDGFVIATQWQAVPLPYPPLVSVSTVHSFDLEDLTWVLVDATNYVVDASVQPAVLLPKEEWNSTRLKVTYIAGYGDAAAEVPQPLRTAILMLVAFLYANREAQEIPKGICQTLDYYRMLYL